MVLLIQFTIFVFKKNDSYIYRLVLKRIQLTGAECEEPLNTRHNGSDKTCKASQKHEYPSIHDAHPNGRH